MVNDVTFILAFEKVGMPWRWLQIRAVLALLPGWVKWWHDISRLVEAAVQVIQAKVYGSCKLPSRWKALGLFDWLREDRKF